MTNYGFNNLNNDNPLMQYLRQYVPQQPPESPQTTETQRVNNNGVAAFEINSKSDIEYIEPDKSGRRQIYICDAENKIYTGRYNHVRKEMDYRAYIDEGQINLFQKNDTSAEMSQIAEALVAVVNKLESMHSEIQNLKNNEPKNNEPKIENSKRRPNGQFKKKGED